MYEPTLFRSTLIKKFKKSFCTSKGLCRELNIVRTTINQIGAHFVYGQWVIWIRCFSSNSPKNHTFSNILNIFQWKLLAGVNIYIIFYLPFCMTWRVKSFIKHTVVLLGCDNWHCYIVYDTDISIIPPHTHTVREYQVPLFLPRDLDNWSFYTELHNVLNFKGNLRFVVACLPHQSVVLCVCVCVREQTIICLIVKSLLLFFAHIMCMCILMYKSTCK